MYFDRIARETVTGYKGMMTIQKSSRRRPLKAKVGASGLIAIAENLFAKDGLDVVSMRNVAASAGLSNPASVQYHFGNREELIRAIWRKRLPEIDRRRAQLFAALPKEGEQADIETLFECAHRPFLDGFETFSQFIAHVLRSRHHLKIRAEFNNLSPVSIQILTRIRKQLPHIDEDVFIFRMITGTLIVLDAIGPSNSAVPNAWRKSGKEKAYFEAIAAAVGLLQAPQASFGKKLRERKGKHTSASRKD